MPLKILGLATVVRVPPSACGFGWLSLPQDIYTAELHSGGIGND